MLLADIRERLSTTEALARLGERLRELRGELRVGPLVASARPPVVASLAEMLDVPLLLVAARQDQAARLREDLCQWLDDERVLLLPSADALPYEHMSQGAEVIAERLRVLQALWRWRRGPQGDRGPAPIVVAPIKALLQPSLSPEELERVARTVAVGERHDPLELARHWSELGYTSVPAVEAPGELSVRGGIVDIFPYTEAAPLRIEFWG